jgi:hypothetical protein
MWWLRSSSLLGALLLFWLTLKTPASTAAAAAVLTRGTVGEGQKQVAAESVEVNFYGESLCPDCQHMVMDVLSPIFENGISNLMKLRYVASGNVRNTSSGSLQCQHGPSECKFNRYINCAQHFHPQQDMW